MLRQFGTDLNQVPPFRPEIQFYYRHDRDDYTRVELLSRGSFDAQGFRMVRKGRYGAQEQHMVLKSYI